MNNFKPYFAVIFTSKHTNNISGYSEMTNAMEQLAKLQKGFLGIESARNEVGITVSYWDSLEAIKNWRMNAEHLLAQKLGQDKWYKWYNIKICKVEREYEFGDK